MDIWWQIDIAVLVIILVSVCWIAYCLDKGNKR